MGQQNDVPLLVGANADEGLPFMDGVKTSAATFDADVAKAFGPLPPALTAAYRPKTDAEAFAALAHLQRDLRFGWDMRTWARLQSSTGHQPVFAYYFTHVPPYPVGSPYAHWGAGHWAEMRYVFDQLNLEDGIGPRKTGAWPKPWPITGPISQSRAILMERTCRRGCRTIVNTSERSSLATKLK